MGEGSSERQKLGTILVLHRTMWQFYPKTYQDTTITSTSPTRVKCIKVNYRIIIQLSLLVLSRVNDYPAALIACLLISVDSTSAPPPHPSHTAVRLCRPLHRGIATDHFITPCKLSVTPAHFSAIKWRWINYFKNDYRLLGTVSSSPIIQECHYGRTCKVTQL